jgi:hypothetical protein
LILRIAGPEEAKNLAGKEGPRLIQIRLATSSLEKSHLLVKHNHHKKRGQLFIRAQIDALSVAAMRPQFRLFVLRNQSPKPSPNSDRFLGNVSNDFTNFTPGKSDARFGFCPS